MKLKKGRIIDRRRKYEDGKNDTKKKEENEQRGTEGRKRDTRQTRRTKEANKGEIRFELKDNIDTIQYGINTFAIILFFSGSKNLDSSEITSSVSPCSLNSLSTMDVTELAQTEPVPS